jgi:hypothetical protein
MYVLSEVQKKVRGKETLRIPESIDVLAEGFQKFQERERPSSLSGVSFIRIAGQAAGLHHANSRDEIQGVLESIKPGGVFVILGHGGIIPCGAVGAKKAQLELSKTGGSLHEHDSIMNLLDSIPPSVEGLGSPDAERENAKHQAIRIFTDAGMRAIIERKNITVVAATFHGWTEFVPINKEWSEEKLFERHPKLFAMRLQLAKGLNKVTSENLDLAKHYAHGIVLYDPMMMRKVLDPLEAYLDVGGICCVDARLQANTPDGPKYLFRFQPNTMFGVTIGMKNGHVSFSYDDEGSITYALGHVNGVNSLNQHGEPGNGHIIIADTDVSFPKANLVRSALLDLPQMKEATQDGSTITFAAFDGHVLRILNQAHGIDMSVDYEPKVNILSVR